MAQTRLQTGGRTGARSGTRFDDIGDQSVDHWSKGKPESSFYGLFLSAPRLAVPGEPAGVTMLLGSSLLLAGASGDHPREGLGDAGQVLSRGGK